MAKFHPYRRKTYKIHKSFHAYRHLKDAKAHFMGDEKELILIRIEIERYSVTGASKTEVSASRVYWGGDYLCPKTNRWKKLKINW